MCVRQTKRERQTDIKREEETDRARREIISTFLRPSNVVRPATLKPENGALCFPFLPSS